ncbi:AraC family transcriptional regulator [Rhodobacteraceae bacterium M382]|nr:AraC family transcriptional regulator [Rhodobacteraceae bacterium M382]
MQPPPDWHRGADDTRLRRVMDFIHDNLGANLSLTAMVRLAAISAPHFLKAFNAAKGVSPLQDVISARLEMVTVLLKTSKLTVAEITWRAGYPDFSRFGPHFKWKCGTTPAAFRAG